MTPSVPPPLRILEALAGAAVAFATLLDVFEAVVVPGATRGWLRVGPRLRKLSLSLWRRKAASDEGPNRSARALAPSLFVSIFVVWVGLLVLGFGLIADGLRASYTPPIHSLTDALFTAGSSIVTIGESGRDARGVARWGVLVSGFAGLAVVTLAITYILNVQGGLKDRDAVVIKLSTTAGQPPTGVALLETYAALGGASELGAFFREWRDWSASTLFSHSAFPVVALFRSISSEMDWPLAIGAVLDAATLYSAFVDGEHRAAAMLLHRDGSRMTATLAELFDVRVSAPEAVDEETLTALTDRLALAGYTVRSGARERATFVSLRGDYHGRLAALAAHLGVDGLVLRP